MSKVFISYRRSDTQMAAGRLRESLAGHMGAEAIFRDKDSLVGGSKWADGIRESLVGPDVVVLALIGPNWLSARNEAGQRRLDDPEDWNRRELEMAFEAGRRVIPVLVDTPTMPAKADLPESLRTLPELEATKLRDDDWDTDVDGLLALLGVRRRSRAPLMAGIAAGLVAVAAGAWFAFGGRAPDLPPLTGAWVMTHMNNDGTKGVGQLELKQSGKQLTGTVAWGKSGPREIGSGVVDGATVRFDAPGPLGAKRVYEGKLNDNGTMISGEASGGTAHHSTWTAARQTSRPGAP